MAGHRKVPIALSIAGSDSSGGAGIQADLKTFSALGVYGATAITALTAQNTTGVKGVEPLAAGFVLAQIEAVLADLEVDAVKTGMLASSEIVAAVAGALAERPGLPVVVDPVMVATSGDLLLDPDAVDAVRRLLLPRATLVTPNLPEAARLLDHPVARDEATMAEQGRALVALGTRAVLMKGGHGRGPVAVDVLVTRAGVRRFEAPRIKTRNTHGTGCTLSAAIAALLARGAALEEAIGGAKVYLSEALIRGRDLTIGSGHGPVDHLYAIRDNARREGRSRDARKQHPEARHSGRSKTL
jgi:hydroxymethylpyrimidine/phosphomethylpyrimidine kinase